MPPETLALAVPSLQLVIVLVVDTVSIATSADPFTTIMPISWQLKRSVTVHIYTPAGSPVAVAVV